MTTVTQADLARHLGTTRSYISALKGADRLVMTADGCGVDLEASLARIEATRDPQRSDVSERHASARAATLLALSSAPASQKTQPTQPSPPQPPPSDSHSLSSDEADTSSYQAARAIKEKYAAKTARMEYERAIAKLIEREAVESAIEDVMTISRQLLEQMPHRIAPQITNQPLDTVRSILKREVRDVLAEMVREFSARMKDLQP